MAAGQEKLGQVADGRRPDRGRTTTGVLGWTQEQTTFTPTLCRRVDFALNCLLQFLSTHCLSGSVLLTAAFLGRTAGELV